jgi:hypothetical protein
MARHRVDSRSASRAASAGAAAPARAGQLGVSRGVVARRIALPAATVAVAGVMTVGVALAGSPAESGGVRQPAASVPPVSVPPASVLSPAGDGVVAAFPAAVIATTSGPTTGGQAAGAVPASTADATAITSAIQHSDLTSQVPASDYRVVDAKVSRTDPAWGWAQLLPVTDTVDRAQGVLHRTSSGWQLVQLGSYEVGCDVAPPPVRADLALECPPAGS